MSLLIKIVLGLIIFQLVCAGVYLLLERKKKKVQALIELELQSEKLKRAQDAPGNPANRKPY